MKIRPIQRIRSYNLVFVFVFVSVMFLFGGGSSCLLGWRHTVKAFVIRQASPRRLVAHHRRYNHRHTNNAFSSLKHCDVHFHVRSSRCVTLDHSRWMSIRGGQSQVEEPSSRLINQPKKPEKITEELSDDEQVETKESDTSNRVYRRPKSIVDDRQTSDDTSTSSFSSFLSHSWQSFVENRLVSSWRRSFRRRAGEMFAIVGFLSSVTTSLYTNRKGQWQRLQPTIDALVKFLKESQLDIQLSQSLLNFRVLDNLVLLSRIQKLLNQHQSLPERAASEEMTGKPVKKRGRVDATSGQEDSSKKGVESSSNDPLIPTVDESLRYMKFATAAYGNAMIRAAQLDVTGQYDTRTSLFSSDMTLTRVSEHVHVPTDDIVLLDIDYNGSDQHLRHFVAIDHAQQEIVLSIRGTFSLAELVVDAAGFCAPFGDGGQAHAEMAKQAQAVWKTAGPTILQVWEAHPHYKLTLTGHSLGAGTACLLHLYLHESAVPNVPSGHQIQCVAFASPPVYANERPSPSLQYAMRRCVNFIHGHDAVPFLSVDSVRHLVSALQWVEKKFSHIRYRERLQLVWGYGDIDPSWVQELRDLPRLDSLPGAPVLTIPAAVNLWLTPWRNQEKSNDNSDEDSNYDPNVYYEWHLCDSSKLATFAGGLQVDPNMLQDHFPPRYEHALHHFHPRVDV